MRINFFNIAWFSKTDGPGLRTVLFLQGCNLRCPWCHSPHSREIEAPLLFNPVRCINCQKCLEVCNRNVHFIVDGVHIVKRDNCLKCGDCVEACPTSVKDSNTGALILPTQSMDTGGLFDLLLPQLNVLKYSGGLTISGGEALLQKEAVLEILKYCKSEGIHTAIETSLCLPVENFQFVSKYVDCWLIGIRGAYLQYRSAYMEDEILENINYLSHLDSEVIVRFPAIKGYTQSEAQLSKLVKYMQFGGFNNIEVMPCNENMLHYYTLSGITPEICVEEALTDKVEISLIVSFFKSKGLNVNLID
jgi:glycyl-radical enzyme activating protein